MNTITTFLFMTLVSFSAYAVEGVETVKVKDNLHVLVSPSGGNVVVSSGEDGVFLIDDQLKGRSEIIRDAAKEISKQDIKFILNTHYHFDHTAGNEFFGEQGAIIVAHDTVRQRLNTRQFISVFGKEMLPLSKEGLPVVTFADKMTLHYNNDDIRFIHIPAAHTDGDVVAIFTKANVIVGGDIVFNGRYPLIDTEHGGSAKGLISAVDMLLGIADDETIIIAGHGNNMQKNELQEYRNTLATITSRIETAIQSGKTVEQVLADKPTQEFDEQLGSGHVSADLLVKTIYQDLK